LSALHIVAYFSFVVLGLPDGMLGVAWPSMSAEFSQPLGALGVLLLGFTAGYLTTTAAAGPLIQRLDYDRHLLLAAGLMLAGGLGTAFAPGWIPVIGASALLGLGAGMLDGGLNAYGAQRFRPRDLNWLHAAYGVGATVGPLIMTPIVASSLSWRIGYVAFGLCAAAALAAFRLSRRMWVTREEKQHAPSPEAAEQAAQTGVSAGPQAVYAGDYAASQTAGPGPPHDTPGDATGDRGVGLVIAGSIIVFFLYTGLEVVAGQWSYTLFTVGRGVEAGRAGPWISVYWGALTVGRVAFGWISERFRAEQLLRATSASATFGVVLVWIGTPPILGAVGLAVLGFSLAPMFPLLIGETPRRVGAGRSDHMVGLQIAASNVGAVSLVGLVGLLVESASLEVIGPALFVNAVLFALFNELVARRSARMRSEPLPG
jgi:fucose permease